MNLSDQVVSLDLAKRLKELGVKQDSLFYWDYPVYQKEELKWEIISADKMLIHKIDEYIAAFTVAELGEILRNFELNHKYYEIDQYNTYDFYNLVLKTTKQLDIPSLYVRDFTEVNARAKMLIYLLENKLMELG